jgi:hypothetical protein
MKRITTLALAVSIALSGCASIVNDPTVPVRAEALAPNGGHVSARCTLVNGKGTWTTSTAAGAAMVHRSMSDLVATCSTPPPEPMEGTATLPSSGSGWLWGNILFGGIIGLVVDMSTGDGWGYPQTVTVPLARTDAPSVPLPSAPSPAQPAPTPAPQALR